MQGEDFYKKLTDRFTELTCKNNLLDEKVEVTGTILKPDEAIGTPQRKDFPLLKGKERLMEANFKGAKGQAFTDMPDNFAGTLHEIISRPLRSNYDRAVLVSSINAVCNYLGISQNYIHCKNEEPTECAKDLAAKIKEEFGSPRIAFVGYQPSMVQELAGSFTLRILDLAEDNIGAVKSGIKIEDGRRDTTKVLSWCDLILATGSTVVNGTITQLIKQKPVIFYGTTIAGTAVLMGLRRFCPKSRS